MEKWWEGLNADILRYLSNMKLPVSKWPLSRSNIVLQSTLSEWSLSQNGHLSKADSKFGPCQIALLSL